MPEWQKTKTPGVYVRHTNACAARAGGRCNCQPSYRAQAYDPETGKRPKSPTYKDINEAGGWLVDYRRGDVAAPTPRSERFTFRELAEQWMRAADRGEIATRGRQRYAARTLEGYRSNLDVWVLPAYGNIEAQRLTVRDWQALIDKMRGQGKATWTINNMLNPVRAIYRWACSPAREVLPVNAVRGVELPASDEKPRERFASPDEAETLMAALPRQLDRLAWGLAFYAGMRRREIRPARWGWVDLEDGVVTVRESKTKAGTGRKVPIAEPLRALLVEAKLAAERTDEDDYLIPGERSGGWFCPDALQRRARRLWAAAALNPIGLHDCRHTYASWMIAAGVNAKALMEFMGHSSIQVTFDRYGHLFPGAEAEAAELLNDYLKRRAS